MAITTPTTRMCTPMSKTDDDTIFISPMSGGCSFQMVDSRKPFPLNRALVPVAMARARPMPINMIGSMRSDRIPAGPEPR